MRQVNTKEWITQNCYKIKQLISGRSNVFLIQKDAVTILVDTSVKRKLPVLIKKIKDNNITGIDYLILTHSHFDHVANAFEIQKKFGAQVLIHKNEAEFLISGQAPLPKSTIKFTRVIMKLILKNTPRFSKTTHCIPDVIINDTYLFDKVGPGIKIISTPGHSAGSVSILIDNEIALAGDTIFGVFANSIFPPFADNLVQLMLSWKKLLKTECKLFLPSHGKGKTRAQIMNELSKRSSG